MDVRTAIRVVIQTKTQTRDIFKQTCAFASPQTVVCKQQNPLPTEVSQKAKNYTKSDAGVREYIYILRSMLRFAAVDTYKASIITCPGPVGKLFMSNCRMDETSTRSKRTGDCPVVAEVCEEGAAQADGNVPERRRAVRDGNARAAGSNATCSSSARPNTTTSSAASTTTTQRTHTTSSRVLLYCARTSTG